MSAFSFDRLPKAQADVLGCIAVGQRTGHALTTVRALAKKGLVEFETRIARDALGSYEIKTPFVPLHIHYAWCAWCDKTIPDDEIAGDRP